MAKKSDYIAVFDSGVGGISVLRQLLRVLPNERYLYFGDSINAPYGTRAEAEVRQLTIAASSLPATPHPPPHSKRCGKLSRIWR